ncbi:uncharacterized protein LOC142814215 [Rhipicephalus microplus]|uniref:uncharacterized protein LOC142814215 n=1 Tax=Rhipicephalus microplus TaxID=6941 RepID=UPI003F6C5815
MFELGRRRTGADHVESGQLNAGYVAQEAAPSKDQTKAPTNWTIGEAPAPGSASVPPATMRRVSVSEPAFYPLRQPSGIKPSSPAPSEPFDVTSSKAASPSVHTGALSVPHETKPESDTMDPPLRTNPPQEAPATAPTDGVRESSGTDGPTSAN